MKVCDYCSVEDSTVRLRRLSPYEFEDLCPTLCALCWQDPMREYVGREP